MSENPFKEFARMMAAEIEKAKQDVDTQSKDLLEVQEEYNYEQDLAQEQIQEDIPAQHTQIVNTSMQRDNIPASPSNIESQRWNDPLRPSEEQFVTVKQMNDHYKLFIQRIQQQMSTMSGGGEVNLRYLDDVDRSSIQDDLFLKYDAATRKFKFASPASSTSVTSVTTATHTVADDEYYLGVDRAGPVSITLPSGSVGAGRELIIKDESGNCSSNPITAVGTVDNDSGGFVLSINNGAIHLIYREGWRII